MSTWKQPLLFSTRKKRISLCLNKTNLCLHIAFHVSFHLLRRIEITPFKVKYYITERHSDTRFNLISQQTPTTQQKLKCAPKKIKKVFCLKKKREATQLSWKFCPPTSISMQKPKRSSCWCKITLTGWNKTKFDISSVGWNSNHQQGTWSHVDILTIFTHPLEKISNWINQISSILDIPLTLNQRGTKAFLNWICKVFVSLFFTPRSSRDRKCQSILIGLLSITISQNCFPNKRKKLRVAKIFSPIETLREIV